MDRETESRAAAAVAFVLGARARRCDPGGGPVSLRDFDLVFPDRPNEPLELTSHHDQAATRTWSRLERLDREAPSLRRSWTLDMPSSASSAERGRDATDVRHFMAEAEPALHQLEQAGYEQFDLGLIYRDERVESAVRSLIRLGCQFGKSRPTLPGSPGRIQPVSPVGGLVTPLLVTTAVMTEARKDDNRHKLRQLADARRRHLFVLFDASSGASFSAVSNTLDSPIPELPEPITTVWVAGGTYRVFSVTPPGDWAEHAIPQELYDRPGDWIDG